MELKCRAGPPKLNLHSAPSTPKASSPALLHKALASTSSTRANLFKLARETSLSSPTNSRTKPMMDPSGNIKSENRSTLNLRVVAPLDSKRFDTRARKGPEIMYNKSQILLGDTGDVEDISSPASPHYIFTSQIDNIPGPKLNIRARVELTPRSLNKRTFLYEGFKFDKNTISTSPTHERFSSPSSFSGRKTNYYMESKNRGSERPF